MIKRLLLLILCVCLFAPPCSASSRGKSEVKKGNILYDQGQFEEALKSYEEALSDLPNSEIVNFNLGDALYKTKDYKAAIGQFEKTLVAEDEAIEQKASYNIGNAKYKYGIGFEDSDLEQAIDLLEQSLRHYERAMELDAEDEDAKFNYEFVKKELERLKQKQQQQQQQQQQKVDDQDQKQQQQQGDDNEQEQQQQQQQQQQDQQQEEKNRDEQQQQKDQQQEQSQDQQQDQDKKDQQQNVQQQQQAAELSEQQALKLLEGYSQDEEPKGLYKEKIPTSGLPEVYKDW
ncbi:MAG: tetratricopeptide repeat protein [Candidatus Omnitrophica bacterium]|nr:tetratricopeptide repeat protein [Candidatus Omnitrophota bacterium]